MHYLQAIVGVSLFVASLVGPVSAEERQDASASAERTEVCTNEAEFAAEVATMRDQGTPVDDVTRAIQSTGREAIPGVPAAVQDEVTARWTELVRQIYASPQLTPAQEKQAAYHACLETPVPPGHQ
jgi:hypothetical protein